MKKKCPNGLRLGLGQRGQRVGVKELNQEVGQRVGQEVDQKIGQKRSVKPTKTLQ